MRALLAEGHREGVELMRTALVLGLCLMLNGCAARGPEPTDLVQNEQTAIQRAIELCEDKPKPSENAPWVASFRDGVWTVLLDTTGARSLIAEIKAKDGIPLQDCDVLMRY